MEKDFENLGSVREKKWGKDAGKQLDFGDDMAVASPG